MFSKYKRVHASIKVMKISKGSFKRAKRKSKRSGSSFRAREVIALVCVSVSPQLLAHLTDRFLAIKVVKGLSSFSSS